MEKMEDKVDYSNYKRFGLMLSISFFIMYLVMYLNLDILDHFFLSLTRFYMTVLMVAPMAIVMMYVMKAMYQDKKVNSIIYASSILIFVLALILLRTQVPISDKQYMKAMIPHHSSAILTSQNADIEDPEVKKLAEEIIKSQKEEIAQMKQILERMD
jgi:uncharacterized protein (DUF305 family)